MTLDRRELLKVTAGVAAVATLPGGASAAEPPRKAIGKVSALEPGRARLFTYPDAASPAYVVKLGRPAEGGVGPDRDIVAFTAVCQHMGCVLGFERGRFVCPCHASMYDPAAAGQCYQGLATESLAQIELRLDEASGELLAVGIRGLIWGRVENVR